MTSLTATSCPVCGTVGEHVCVRLPGSATVAFPAAHVPCRCPVCWGRGTVPGNFYTGLALDAGTGETTCRSCGGRGVVWR